MYTLFHTEANTSFTNTDLVPGLCVIENYINDVEHKQLIDAIDKHAWSNELKRRVQHYGYKYDYKARSININMKAQDFPDWAKKIAKKLVDDEHFSRLPDQLIINEYMPGQGIADHIDCEPCFEGTVVSISLGSYTTMNFTNKFTKKKISIVLPPKSAVILKDKSRYEWLHGISAKKSDMINGNRIQRSRRISLTFRRVILEQSKNSHYDITKNVMNKELSYWLALAHVPKIKTKKKNEIIVRLFEQGKSIIDFFELDRSAWEKEYEISKTDVGLFLDAKKELSNYAFLVEDLLEQGYNILPITSKDYSPVLKKNLGRSYVPPVIYTKGNLQILKEKSVAIVGSRKANDVSLGFTDNVAQKVSKDYKVVVSGFAKGVDKQALDSALKYKGQSIIVLPQGIATFKSGFKEYYKEIIAGDVLVLSTFHPKAPWSAQLAMARNRIIYGLASEIYVAESSEKGGTWSGVIDGLRKGRSIYVRKPDARERNANGILISKGAKAVDQKGNATSYEISTEPHSVVSEPEANEHEIENKIVALLKQGTFNSRNIVDKLNMDWPARKVTSYLKKNPEIEVLKGKPMKFTYKSRNSDG